MKKLCPMFSIISEKGKPEVSVGRISYLLNRNRDKVFILEMHCFCFADLPICGKCGGELDNSLFYNFFHTIF